MITLKKYFILSFILSVFVVDCSLGNISTLNFSDPFPPHKTGYPLAHLQTWQKDSFKNGKKEKVESFNIDLSVFIQKADKCKKIDA